MATYYTQAYTVQSSEKETSVWALGRVIIEVTRPSLTDPRVDVRAHYTIGFNTNSPAVSFNVNNVHTMGITFPSGNTYYEEIDFTSAWKNTEGSSTPVHYKSSSGATTSARWYNYKNSSEVSTNFTSFTSGTKKLTIQLKFYSQSAGTVVRATEDIYISAPEYAEVCSAAFTSPAAGSNNYGRITVTGTCNSSTNQIYLGYINDSGARQYTTIIPSNSSWSFSYLPTRTSDFTQLITVQPKNSSNSSLNGSQIQLSFNWKYSHAPTISITPSKSGSIFRNETVDLTVTLSGGTSDYSSNYWYDNVYAPQNRTVGPGTYQFISYSLATSQYTSATITISVKSDIVTVNNFTCQSTNSNIVKQNDSSGRPVIISKMINYSTAATSNASGANLSYSTKLLYCPTITGTYSEKILGSSSFGELNLGNSLGSNSYFYKIKVNIVSDCDGTAEQISNTFYYPGIPQTTLSFSNGYKVVNNENILLKSFNVSWPGLDISNGYYNAQLNYWLDSTASAQNEIELSISDVSAGVKTIQSGTALVGGGTFEIAANQQVYFQLIYTSPDDIDGIKSPSYLIGRRSIGAGINESLIVFNYNCGHGPKGSNWYIKPFTTTSDKNQYGLTVSFPKGDIKSGQNIRYELSWTNVNEFGTLHTSKKYLGIYSTSGIGYELWTANDSWVKQTQITTGLTDTTINLAIQGENVAGGLGITGVTKTGFSSHWWDQTTPPNSEYPCQTSLTVSIDDPDLQEDSNEKTTVLYVDFRESPVWNSSNINIGIDYDTVNNTNNITTCDFTFTNNPKKMINYKEKIAFLIPEFTDYNEDAQTFDIQIARLDSNIDLQSPSYYDSQFTNLISVPISGLSKISYSGNNYYLYKFEMPQYQYNKFLLFKLNCIDAKSNKSIPLYWNNYLTGCRIQPMTWSIVSSTGGFGDVEGGATRAVFETLSIGYNISDNGGSLFTNQTGGFVYNNFKNLERDLVSSYGWKIHYELFYHDSERGDLLINEGDVENLPKINNNVITIPVTLSSDNENFSTLKAQNKIYELISGRASLYKLTTDTTQSSSKTYYISKERLYLHVWLDYAYGVKYQGSSPEPAYVRNLAPQLYTQAPIYAYIAEIPTVAYRKNKIGINTEAPRSDALLDINVGGSGDKIYLTNINGVIGIIDLNEGTLTGYGEQSGIIINLSTGAITNAIIDSGSFN